MIGLYQEPGWETVTALFLRETTDLLFLRLTGNPSIIGKGRVADNPLGTPLNAVSVIAGTPKLTCSPQSAIGASR